MLIMFGLIQLYITCSYQCFAFEELVVHHLSWEVYCLWFNFIIQSAFSKVAHYSYSIFWYQLCLFLLNIIYSEFWSSWLFIIGTIIFDFHYVYLFIMLFSIFWGSWLFIVGTMFCDIQYCLYFIYMWNFQDKLFAIQYLYFFFVFV